MKKVYIFIKNIGKKGETKRLYYKNVKKLCDANNLDYANVIYKIAKEPDYELESGTVQKRFFEE